MPLPEALRIAHMGTEAGWRGGEQQQFWLADGLRRRGHLCLMLCRSGGEMSRRAAAAGFDTAAIPVRGELDVLAVTRAATVLRRFRPDVLHLHDGHAVLLGSLAAKLARAPAVVASRRVDFRIRSRWKYTWAVDRIIAISAAVRAVLIDCGVPDEHISVVHSGVDLARLRDLPERSQVRRELELTEGDLAVGMVAALTDHKGHCFLLDAWPGVLAAHPRARLFLAGSGELDGELRAQAGRLGLGDSVRFLGYRNDATALLPALDLFVMSSHMEGLCTSLMDAQAVGLPIVATMAGGIPEIVEDGITGILVPPRDPAALATAVSRVLTDQALRRTLGEAGLRRAGERFDLADTVEGTLGVYRRVLSERAADGR
jgi:glycosyltransferase involved in cell wall biosynthesis